jgi:hypothetical protein
MSRRSHEGDKFNDIDELIRGERRKERNEKIQRIGKQVKRKVDEYVGIDGEWSEVKSAVGDMRESTTKAVKRVHDLGESAIKLFNQEDAFEIVETDGRTRL